MRSVPTTFAARLAQAIQAAATNAAPSLDLWITRPTTPLTDEEFLEKQKILTGTGITDIAVSACHPVIYKPVTKIYVGYVDNGAAHVKYAIADEVMDSHTWLDTGFSETASAIALEFDGTMPKDRKGRVEFVTEEYPWVFWINDGIVYGKVLGDTTPVTLVAANATDVFAVRGQWSEVGSFDFGLVLFMIISGQLYYRQLIDGEWYDAEPVTTVGSLDLTALTLTKLAAMRTWDYRLVVQVQDSAGTMYELFSQYMGIGKQNVEHLEITAVTAEGGMTEVFYTDTKLDENVEISSINAIGDCLSLISGWSISCANADDGTGNWGTILIVTFNKRLFEVGAGAGFYLKDADNRTYAPISATVSNGGYTVTFVMTDFNAAEGQTCEFVYSPGTIMSEAVLLEACTISFVPINLVAPIVPAPEMEDVWNE